MALPVKTVSDDIDTICAFLAKKPTGATVKEARAVIDPKHLDPRKLSALKAWGFVEEIGDKLKLTATGRSYSAGSKEPKQRILLRLIQSCMPYSAMVERAAHRKEESVSSNDAAAHWHDHFADEVGRSDETLKDQALTFFNVAQAAGLGAVMLGRRGNPTRLIWDQSAIASYDGANLQPDTGGSDIGEEAGRKDSDEGKHSAEPVKKIEALAQPPHTPHQLGQSIFLAHGKNKAPLDQLQKILRQFNIPFKIATEEPNLGRPIGGKVREVMQTCNCAILIFTADEKFYDKDGNEIWRPSENVGHELGACGFLYDQRIVIIKEDKILMPTNYRELGYISFSAESGLEVKAMEILKELIGFGIVKVST